MRGLSSERRGVLELFGFAVKKGGKSREVRGHVLTIFGGAETLLPGKVISVMNDDVTNTRIPLE